MSGQQSVSEFATRLLATLMLIAAHGADAANVRLTFDGAAERIMPGVVSREHRETHVTTHPTNRLILWGCDDCPRGRGKDLWMTQMQGDAWSGAGRAPMSSSTDESAPAFSADGVWLYFVSDRRGGFGGADLHRAAYASHREQFSTVENLGSGINSAGEEGAATATAGGNRVIFASRGRQGARGWDLFESRRVNGLMTQAAPIKALNTEADEFDPTLLAEEAGLVFTRAERDNPASASLWFAPRQGDGFGAAVRLGEPVNVPGKWARAPAQDLSEPGVLLFARSDSGAANATTDLYKIRYRLETNQEAPRAADD